MSTFNAKRATPASTFAGSDVFPFGTDAEGWHVITGTDLAATLGGMLPISDTTAAGTLTAVVDGDYLLGLNDAGTYVRKVAMGASGRSLLSAADGAAVRAVLGTGTADATSFLRGDGTWQPLSGIVTTDASLLTSGTLADARLSSNVPLKNATNTFTQPQVVTAGSFSGSTPANPGVKLVWSDNAAGGYIGLMGSYWNSIGIWSPGQNPAGDTPALQLSGGDIYCRGPFRSTANAFTFNNRNDHASGNPGFQVVGSGATVVVAALRNTASQTANTLQLDGISSSTDTRAQAAINSSWSDSTDATRTGRLSLGAYYTTTLREGLRITADSYGVVLYSPGTLNVDEYVAARLGVQILSGNWNAAFNNQNLSASYVLKRATVNTMLAAPAADNTPLAVRGYTSQTGNLTEWQDSGGTVGARVTANREFSNQYGYALSEGFGSGASITGNAGHAFGYGTVAGGSCVSVGREAQATASAAIGIGAICLADGAYSLAVGAASRASQDGAIALGYLASATAAGAVAIGYGCASAVAGQFRYYTQSYDPSFVLARDSSTSTQRPVGGLTASWADSTDATRTGQLSLGAYYLNTLQTGLTVAARSGGRPLVTLSNSYVGHNTGTISDYTLLTLQSSSLYGARLRLIAPTDGVQTAPPRIDFEHGTDGTTNSLTATVTSSGNGSYYTFNAGGLDVAAFRRYDANTFGAIFGANSTSDPGGGGRGTVRIQSPPLSSEPVLLLVHRSSPSADLTQWQNSSGTVVAAVGPAGTVKTLSTTVAGLPAATAGAGARAFVTDATATTFLSVVAGGGANAVPVVSDGTNWLIG